MAARTFMPRLVVFIASMGTMIVELVAGRLVAKYLGNSLFTWTGVIGVVLGGISLGNAIGGWLADRRDPRRLAPLLLSAASLATALVIVADLGAGAVAAHVSSEGISVATLAGTLALVAVLFFLPSAALGTISPVMAKYALEGAPAVGRTVGGVYAAGALGSIAGTFLAGYLLIPLLGLTGNLLAVAIVLVLLALLLAPAATAADRRRRLAGAAWAVLLAGLAVTDAPDAAERRLTADPSGEAHVVFEAASAYQRIRVTDIGDPVRERTLVLDALIHSRVDPGRPEVFLYEYERIFASLAAVVADRLAPHGELRTITLGGGGFTLPQWLERRYSGGSHEVLELDPQVVEAARAHFGLSRASGIAVAVGDARASLAARRGPPAHVVFGDAFNSFAVPAHLTTVEFVRLVDASLVPGGFYLANAIDILEAGAYLAALLATLETVFPDVAIYHPPGLRPSLRSTFVLAASRAPLPMGPLIGGGGEIVGERLLPSDLDALRRRGGRQPLTDNRAPVENLLAPVFLDSIR